MVIFDKATGLAVSAFYATDADVVEKFKQQFTNHWFYSQNLTEIDRWSYNGEKLTEVDNWAAIQAAKAEAQIAAAKYQTLSVVTFKLAFSAEERVAIKNSSDPLVQDFYELVNDPRVTEVNLNLPSVQSSIEYLESSGLLAVGRGQEILNSSN